MLSRRSRLLALVAALLFLAAGMAAAMAAGLGPVVRFAVVGDIGTGDEHQRQIARQMLAWHKRLPYDLVLTLGDNIYGGFLGWGGGDKKDFDEKFDRPYSSLLQRGVVFRASLGNHDLRHRQGQDLIEAYDRFHIDGPNGYYNFTAGSWTGPDGDEAPLVEFFVLNTIRLEQNKHDPEQMAWLEEALAASRARWRILYGHHPLYSSAGAHGSDLALREKLLPLLQGPDPSAPRVQVALAGHDHIYQRFHPQAGITYFVCGSSGQLRRGDARPSPLVAAVEDQVRVFMLWEATADELRFRAINENGRVFDCGALGAGLEAGSLPCESLSGSR